MENLVKKTIIRWFRPTRRVDSVTDITADDLRSMGVRAIALDADNTTSYDRTTTPLPGAVEWIKKMKDAGFKVVLLSNGPGKRAGHLASVYGISVISMSCKPLPIGYVRAVLKFRTRPDKFVMIGDQIFTDIWGANLTGFKTIYCKPAGPDEGQKTLWFIKRISEKILFWYFDRIGDDES